MKKMISTLSLSATVCASLSAGTFILGSTSDVDPSMASMVHGVGMGIYDRAELGSSIKVMEATTRPDLKFGVVKKDYPNEMTALKARKDFEDSLVQFLGLALRANRGREADGALDGPRFVRELRNHIGDDDEVVVAIVGNVLWKGDPEYSFVDEEESDPDFRLRRPSHASIVASKFLSPFSMEGVPDMPGCRVVWLDPTGDKETGDDAFKSEVANFWSCMFGEVSMEMAPVQSSVSTAVAMAIGEGLEVLSPALRASETEVKMLTLAQMRPDYEPRKKSPGFSDVWLADLSGSQSKVREAMARRLADARGVAGEYHGLFVFESGGGGLYSENADVLEIAAAFRQAEPNGGADTPGAFSATLKNLRDELRERRRRESRVWILSDVPPSPDDSVPDSERYPAVLADLLSDGHEVTFLRTNRSLDAKAFLPRELKIKVANL